MYTSDVQSGIVYDIQKSFSIEFCTEVTECFREKKKKRNPCVQ